MVVEVMVDVDSRCIVPWMDTWKSCYFLAMFKFPVEFAEFPKHAGIHHITLEVTTL